jgi:hypothetical protein
MGDDGARRAVSEASLVGRSEMNFATIGLIVVAAWITLLIVVVAMCRVAAHADAASDRMHAAVR